MHHDDRSPHGGRAVVVRPGQAIQQPAAQRHRALATPRLHLAPLDLSDLEELWALHSDPALFTADSTASLTDRAQMRTVLAAWCEHWDHQGFGYRALRRRGDEGVGHGPVLGVAGLTELSRAGAPPVLSVYYRLAQHAQGRGLAHEALTAILSDAEQDPRTAGRSAHIITDLQNAPSLRLAARLGFTALGDEQVAALGLRDVAGSRAVLRRVLAASAARRGGDPPSEEPSRGDQISEHPRHEGSLR